MFGPIIQGIREDGQQYELVPLWVPVIGILLGFVLSMAGIVVYFYVW